MTPSDLRAARKSLAMTQHALAAALGIHPQSITAWERGKRPVPQAIALAVEHLSCTQLTPEQRLADVRELYRRGEATPEDVLAATAAATAPHISPFVDGCSACDTIKTAPSQFGPRHFASDRCESGKRNHCTCDTCF